MLRGLAGGPPSAGLPAAPGTTIITGAAGTTTATDGSAGNARGTSASGVPPPPAPSQQQRAAARMMVDGATSSGSPGGLLDFLAGSGPRPPPHLLPPRPHSSSSSSSLSGGLGHALFSPPPAAPGAGDSSNTVWYRVTDPGGLHVRSGLEPHSPSLAILPPGAALAASEEALDSRGAARLRLASPPQARGGWAGKRPGALERLGEGLSPVAPRPPMAVGRAGGGANTAAAAEAAEAAAAARALAGLEDALEEAGGQEGFRREDRYFPASASSAAGGRRGSVSSLRAAAGGGGGPGGVRYAPSYYYSPSYWAGGYAAVAAGAPPRRAHGSEPSSTTGRPARRLRAGGGETVQASWTALVEQAPKAPSGVDGRLAQALDTVRVLLARQMVLALLLCWQEEEAAAAAAGGESVSGDLGRLLLLSSTDAPEADGEEEETGRVRVLAQGELCGLHDCPGFMVLGPSCHPLTHAQRNHTYKASNASSASWRSAAPPTPRGRPTLRGWLCLPQQQQVEGVAWTAAAAGRSPTGACLPSSLAHPMQ